MSRYIDADAVIAELQKDETQFDKEAEDARNDPSYTEGYSDSMWSRANGIRDAIIEIYDAPSIDIVRCKECRLNPKWSYVGCPMPHKTDLEDDFCSYAERREDGE